MHATRAVAALMLVFPLAGLALAVPDVPLWTSGGTRPSWQYGLQTAPLLPVAAQYDTNLLGNYNDIECSWVQSPAVPGATTLSFDHSFQIEGYYDSGAILASSDGGTEWTYIGLPEYNDLAFVAMSYCSAEFTAERSPYGTGAFSGVSNGTGHVEADLAEWLDIVPDDPVTVRFLLATDASVTHDGWHVANVELGGVRVLI